MRRHGSRAAIEVKLGTCYRPACSFRHRFAPVMVRSESRSGNVHALNGGAESGLLEQAGYVPTQLASSGDLSPHGLQPFLPAANRFVGRPAKHGKEQHTTGSQQTAQNSKRNDQDRKKEKK